MIMTPNKTNVIDEILYKYYDIRLSYIFGNINSKLTYIGNTKNLTPSYTKIMTYDGVEFYITDHFIERFNERYIKPDIYYTLIDIIDIYEIFKIKYGKVHNMPRKIRMGIRGYMYILEKKKHKIKIVSSFQLNNKDHLYYINKNIIKLNFTGISDYMMRLYSIDNYIDTNEILVDINQNVVFYVNI